MVSGSGSTESGGKMSQSRKRVFGVYLLEMVSRLPGKVLFEKVTSVLGFAGVSQLSWGWENAFKVKVRHGFNITHRWDRERGLLGEPQGPGSPEGWAPEVRLGTWTGKISQKGHIYFMTKTLSFPKGQ